MPARKGIRFGPKHPNDQGDTSIGVPLRLRRRQDLSYSIKEDASMNRKYPPFAFVLPFMVLFAVFFIGPLLYALYVSLFV